MAEDIRHRHTEGGMSVKNELIAECRRQQESCSFTSAALHIWLKQARVWRALFLVAPILLGGAASALIYVDGSTESGKVVAALFGLAAGFFPAIHLALKLDMGLYDIGRAATEFTNLRDRFRLAANVVSQGPEDEFTLHVEGLMDRMDSIRNSAPSIPEHCFQEAQKKMNSGDFAFDSDTSRKVRNKT